MRAIGFSNITKRTEMQDIINMIIKNANLKEFTANEEGVVVAEFDKDFGLNMGIGVCGELDENENFLFDYYFPYLRPLNISSNEEICIDRQTSNDAYVGICDEMRVGISLIFYVQNKIAYINRKSLEKGPETNATLSLAALSLSGKILMPVMKTEKTISNIKRDTQKKSKLLAAAKNGDTDAMEALALKDMDTYAFISKNVSKTDVYTLVDTFFMPYAMECDQYSILGEILECKQIENTYTHELVYQMTLECNDMIFDVCINAEDLEGEPAKNRRFKGTIWMQGYLNYSGQTIH